jgi:hypothetical protein
MNNDLIRRSDVIKFLNDYLGDCYRVSRRNYEKTMLDAISMDFEAVITDIPAVEPKTKVIAQINFDEDELREIIHETVERIKEEYDIVNNTNTVSEWIPCSERLPHAEKKEYWVCTNSGYQCQCRWTNVNHLWTNLTTDWHWHIMDIPQYTEVVAWMPLPTAYKEGADGCSSK